jgi:hypothetical protein
LFLSFPLLLFLLLLLQLLLLLLQLFLLFPLFLLLPLPTSERVLYRHHELVSCLATDLSDLRRIELTSHPSCSSYYPCPYP